MSERWNPEKDGYYFFINFDGRVIPTFHNGYDVDSRLIKFGNCFETRAEAEAAAEKVKALMLSLHCDESLPANDETLQEKQLPDWCKVGEWVYYSDDLLGGTYAKIKKIADGEVFLDVDYGEKVLSFSDITYALPARVIPYSDDEFRLLVGHVIAKKNERYLVTAYKVHSDCIPRVRLADMMWIAADILVRDGYTTAGKPAGEFQYLKNGEWVQ